MDLLLEFSDSEVAQVELLAGSLRVRFAAACVVRSAAPLQAATQGYAQSVELLLFEATATEPLSGLIGRVAQGRIAVAGRWAARLALPCRIDAPIQLELVFANHGTLNATGSALGCRFAVEPNFNEWLAC
jgi:hypothetical protein